MKSFPGVAVDLGLEGGLERLVGVVGAQEVGVADEEALLVVVGVDEPAGDAVGPSLRISPVLGWNTSTPLTLTWICRPWRRCPGPRRISMSGSPKITNRLPLPVFFRSPAMLQVGVHARLEDGDAAELAELGGVRLVTERTGDQHIVVGVGGFAGGGDQIGAGDGAELGADEDARAAFGAGVRVTFDVAPSAQMNGPGQGVSAVKEMRSRGAPAARPRCSGAPGSWSRSLAARRSRSCSRRDGR